MLILTLAFQQLSRRSDLLPKHLQAEAWNEGPTTVWLWWLETSLPTVRQEAAAPALRCWPQLEGSETSTRSLLWGAAPACHDLAINPSSKSSLGDETSEHKVSDVQSTHWNAKTQLLIVFMDVLELMRLLWRPPLEPLVSAHEGGQLENGCIVTWFLTVARLSYAGAITWVTNGSGSTCADRVAAQRFPWK